MDDKTNMNDRKNIPKKEQKAEDVKVFAATGNPVQDIKNNPIEVSKESLKDDTDIRVKAALEKYTDDMADRFVSRVKAMLQAEAPEQPQTEKVPEAHETPKKKGLFS